MKKSITLFVSFLLFTGLTFAQDGTHLYVGLYLAPKMGHVQQLNTALASHNKQFHGEGPYAAVVQSILTGRRSGEYGWLMGPCTFADLDTEPLGHADHDNDWNNNVLPHVEDLSNIEYWERDNDLVYEPEGYSTDKLRIRFHRTKRGAGGQFADHFASIVKVYKEKNYQNSVSLYWNRFPTAYGRNIATVSGFQKWAEFDEDSGFVSDFEEVHGEGSWAPWLEKLYELTEWTDNEVRQVIPALSGME